MNHIHRTYIDTFIQNQFKWNMRLSLMGVRQVRKTKVARMNISNI